MDPSADGPALHGVWSLLDSEATGRTRNAWSRLERDFGLRGVLAAPYPHFSYQIVYGYDRAAVESALSTLADEIEPFEVRTTGLATFAGPWPTVYITVEKDALLRATHGRVWTACLPFAVNPVPYYGPDSWTPHISLAYGDESNSVPLTGDQVREILATMSHSDFHWTISIDNLALIEDDGGTQAPVSAFPLRGR